MLTDTMKTMVVTKNQTAYTLFEQLQEKLGLGKKMEVVENKYLHSCHLLMDGNEAVGRFALYVNEQLSYQGHTVICIGAYACVNNDAVAAELLNVAITKSEALGYHYIIGPMNGSTWNDYRFAKGEVDRSFFLDVTNPSYYNNQFVFAGFRSIAEYCSGEDNSLRSSKEQLDRFQQHYTKQGVKIRNIDLDNLQEELYKIADFANKAFADNFLFTPMCRIQFVQKYTLLQAFMNPEFILIAEDQEGNMQAILFAIEDISNSERKTLIIKTMACKLDTTFRGIATYLGRRLVQIAYEKGYERIIHALMHKSNLSLNASNNFGSTFREYVLYGKKLTKNYQLC